MIVQKKIFLGCKLSYDIKKQLSHNQENLFSIFQLKNEDYIGILLSSPAFLFQIKKEIENFKKIIENSCPEKAIESSSILLFSQIFIG